MSGEAINPDPEQQQADNEASRHQSGLEPQPQEPSDEPAPDDRSDTDRRTNQEPGRQSSVKNAD